MSWLISKALMNLLSLREQVEEYLGDTCLDGEPSAPLNGNPTQQAYLPQDKMTDFSRLSPFGMTFKPLTENLGEELLTLYLAAFPAPTFPQQEKEQELMEKPLECGEKWRGSFTKYDPDTSLWKTHQCSLLGDLEEFSETWPKWGLMRNGECWEQPPLDYPITENEFGCWLPTMTVSMQNGCSSKRYKGSQEYRGSMPMEWIRTSKACAQYFHPDYAELLMDFPDKWTDLKPLETHKFQEWQQELGKS